MVHQFQYDVFSRGRAGANLQALQAFFPPLWLTEGMAEYLSLGSDHRFTDMWMRDAAVNGDIPSIEQMTLAPDRYFPYRFGESLLRYIGERWGDQVIGQILEAMPNVGIERAFRRELGLSLEELSDDWKDALQKKYLPTVVNLDRPRRFADNLLSPKKSGGNIFLAPSLSDDGSKIRLPVRRQFPPRRSLHRSLAGRRTHGQAHPPPGEEQREPERRRTAPPLQPELVLAGRQSGGVRRPAERQRCVVPDPDPRWNDTADRSAGGRCAEPGVYSGRQAHRVQLEQRRHHRSRDRAVDGTGFRQLTNDRYGDFMPSVSPDGKTIAFSSDRGGETDFELLRFSRWKVSLYDMATGNVTVCRISQG